MDEYQQPYLPQSQPTHPLTDTAGAQAVAVMEPAILKPWGGWATVGWTALCLLAGFAVQISVLVVAVIIGMTSGRINLEMIESLAKSPWVLGSCTLLSTPIVLGFVWLLTWLRGWRFEHYNKLVSYQPIILIAAFAATVGFIAVEMAASTMAAQPMPDFMRDLFSTPAALPLILLAIVVAAPIGEELLFRGFMFRGLAASKAGVGGAIIITSLTWTVLHIQYGFVELAFIFMFGLLLGYVRARSNSTWPAIYMHMLLNFTSSVITILALRFGW